MGWALLSYFAVIQANSQIVEGAASDVLFAESKTYDQFKSKDFSRMRHLAKKFPGAVLVFATLRKVLTAAEIKGITRIAKAGRKWWKNDRPTNPVLILTGTELLSHAAPPYCWNEDNRKKFTRVYGLLELCDATQQVYLNLPSWHTDWHKKWEMRRQQISARNLGNTNIH